MKNQVCSGAFILKNDKFLFGKRSNNKSWAPGKWDIVGGHSLKKENPFDTLKRETLEEVGVTVLQAKFITLMNVFDDSINKYFAYYIYLVTEYEGKPINCSKEHSEIKWFTRNELDDVSLALNDYLNLLDNCLNK